jgi:two-component system LytT family sensor kinase
MTRGRRLLIGVAILASFQSLLFVVNFCAAQWWEGILLRPAVKWGLWAIVALLLFRYADRMLQQERATARRILFRCLIAGLVIVPSYVACHVFLYSLLGYVSRWEAVSKPYMFAAQFYMTCFIYSLLISGIWWYSTYRNVSLRRLDALLLDARLARARIQAAESEMASEEILSELDGIGRVMESDREAAENMTTTLADAIRSQLRKSPMLEDPFPVAMPRWKRRLYALTGWYAAGTVMAVLDSLFARWKGSPGGWKEVLIWYVIWTLWALVAPLVSRLGRRFPLESERWIRRLALHCLISLLFALSIDLFYGALLTLATPGIPGSFVSRTFRFMIEYLFFYDTLMYFAILGITQGLHNHEKLRNEQLRIAEAENSLQIARLQLLKTQLHPHFLFNSLHSLCGLIRENVPEARKMLASMRLFLEKAFKSRDSQEVPLREELDVLGCYLQIQQVRFQDRLNVRLDIEPSASSVRVPSLILQPLVENAIKHGLKNRSGKVNIRIAARADGGRTVLEVADDGPGLPEHLQEGIGLCNTRNRLESLYGPGCLFSIGNSPVRGVRVTVEILRENA